MERIDQLEICDRILRGSRLPLLGTPFLRAERCSDERGPLEQRPRVVLEERERGEQGAPGRHIQVHPRGEGDRRGRGRLRRDYTLHGRVGTRGERGRSFGRRHPGHPPAGHQRGNVDENQNDVEGNRRIPRRHRPLQHAIDRQGKTYPSPRRRESRI